MKSKFTNEEKQAILDRYISKSESPASIIKSVGISKSTFYKWLSDYRAEQAEAKRKGLTFRNFNLLETKVKRLEGIIEIIKKANVLPNAPLQQKLYAAEKLSGEYSVHMICDALDIARGTYYNHVLRNKRDNTWYAKRREELRIQIQEVFDENHQIFGAEKITLGVFDNNEPAYYCYKAAGFKENGEEMFCELFGEQWRIVEMEIKR